MKNDPWFQFTLNNWSPPDQSLPFLKMLLHPSMYFSMSPTTFFILSDSRKYLYFLQVLPCSKHLLIELSTKNSFSQSCKTTYLHDIEWKAAQLKFNCLLGQSKIWCSNEFSYLLYLSDLPLVNSHELFSSAGLNLVGRGGNSLFAVWRKRFFLISRCCDKGCQWATMSGGRPRLRPWLRRLVRPHQPASAIFGPILSSYLDQVCFLGVVFFFLGVTFSFSSILSPPPC